ncbi:MAG: PilZ domain-containing protein [Syntrophobacter sp.]
MDTMKVYVTESRAAYVACPNCSASNQINLSTISSGNVVSISCDCNHTFSVFVDRRKFYRKQVNSTGLCFSPGDPSEGTLVKVLDISKSGIRFIKYGGKDLSQDEVVRIKMRLDDSTNVITFLASVASVRSESVGASFVKLDEHTQKVLGFFLLP